MVIDKIGALSNIQSAYQNQIRKNSGTEAKDSKSDRVESSGKAKERSELLSAIRTAVDKVDDGVPQARDAIRHEKVAEAKKKLENGSLLSDAVIEKIAERIVDSLGL